MTAAVPSGDVPATTDTSLPHLYSLRCAGDAAELKDSDIKEVCVVCVCGHHGGGFNCFGSSFLVLHSSQVTTALSAKRLKVEV